MPHLLLIETHLTIILILMIQIMNGTQTPELFPDGRVSNLQGSNPDQSTIFGTVRDLSTGQARGGLNIRFTGSVSLPFQSAALSITTGGSTVRTDGNGHYAITGLPAGRYQLTFELDDSDRPSKTVPVTVDGQKDVRVDMTYYSRPLKSVIGAINNQDFPQITAYLAATNQHGPHWLKK